MLYNKCPDRLLYASILHIEEHSYSLNAWQNDVASSLECEVGVDYGTLFGGTETLFRLCSPRSEIVSVGKFKEGGRLDRLDKFLSGPIFRMEVLYL